MTSQCTWSFPERAYTCFRDDSGGGGERDLLNFFFFICKQIYAVYIQTLLGLVQNNPQHPFPIWSCNMPCRISTACWQFSTGGYSQRRGVCFRPAHSPLREDCSRNWVGLVIEFSAEQVEKLLSSRSPIRDSVLVYLVRPKECFITLL